MINILLAAFVVFFGMMSFDVWSKGDETIPEMQTGKNPEKPLPGKGIMERKMPPDSTYSIVAEKNLFSPNRSEIVPEKKQPAPEGPLKISEKMVFLYGVVVMGDRKKALVSNPETKPLGGKKPAKEKWVALGDMLGNFSVADIKKDRIVLAEGDKKHEILLYDKNKPARKIIVPEKPAASAETARVSTAPAAAATATTTKPGTGAPSSKVAEGKSAPEGEYKIINTPFGPVKRKIQ